MPLQRGACDRINENVEPDHGAREKMRENARFFDKSFGELKALRRDEKLTGTQARLLSLGEELEARERRLMREKYGGEL